MCTEPCLSRSPQILCLAAPPPIPPTMNRCLLLELPAELRNRIYEFAVMGDFYGFPECDDDLFDRPLINIEDCIFDHDMEGPWEPALLRTCSQIRREAGPVYYLAQDFVMHTHHYDALEAILFASEARACIGKLWQKVKVSHDVQLYNGKSPCKQCTTMGKGDHWSALLKWLEAYYHGEVHAIQPDLNTKGTDMAKEAFLLVDKRKKDLIWSEMQKELEIWSAGKKF